jgi:HPt (histidine-containing phosphotransfer) domain-containing protein
MDDYVVKPVRLDRLSRALAQCRHLASRVDESLPSVAGPSSADPVDHRVLHDLQAELGGADELRQVIATFLEGSPRFVGALRDAAARSDVTGMGRAAHALKSSSTMLGAIELSNRCAEVEESSRSGIVVDAVAHATAVEGLYRAVVVALEAHLARLASSAITGPPPSRG